MDWDLAIKRNSEALIGIVADLFAMLGLVGEATVSRIAVAHSTGPCCAFLRPAESALRRLIVVAARGLVVKLGAFASQAGRGSKIKEGGGTSRSLLPALRSAETHRSSPRRRMPTRHPARASTVQRRQSNW